MLLILDGNLENRPNYRFSSTRVHLFPGFPSNISTMLYNHVLNPNSIWGGGEAKIHHQNARVRTIITLLKKIPV